MSAPLNTALALARHGLAVVPLWPPVQKNGKLACACGKADCRSPGKHPIGRLGDKGPLIAQNGVLSATTDSGVIKHWWSLAPEANIGVSTATLIPLDIDVRHDGLESLDRLEAAHGKMPPTWTATTGSGGLHYYYRRPAGLELSLPIIAGEILKRGGVPPFGEGIDIPSYLVAPPSRHISGGVYQWEVDGHPKDVPLADAPQWIVDRLTNIERQAATTGRTSPEDWARETGELITEYHDVHAAKVAGKLLKAISLHPRFVMGLLHAWNQTYCRPPISNHDLKQIFDRIARAEATRLLEDVR